MIAVVEPRDLPIDQIGPSPYQPRQSFPEEEIRALADSIAAQGLIQPVVVRVASLDAALTAASSSRYELIDGERRWRAHQVLGLTTIRAEIQEHSDAQARAIVLASGLQRKDLNPIEQACALQAALDARDFAGPTELARALGLSQGHVSNTLRLLRLPAEWRDRVISGEITAFAARAIIPWRGRPAILKAIEKSLEDFERWESRKPSGEEFAERVANAVLQSGRRIDRQGCFDELLGRSVPPFAPTEEQRQALDIVEIYEGVDLDEGEGGPKIEVALNAKLWDKLQAVYVKALVAREEANREGKKARGGEGEKRRGGEKERPPTKAEIEAKKRHDAKRRAEQARLTARKVWYWRITRLRAALAESFLELPAGDQARVTCYFLCASSTWSLHGSEAERRAHDREGLFDFASRVDGHARPGKLWPSLAVATIEAMPERLLATVRELLWSSQHGPQIRMPDDVVEAMAGQFHVDLADLWKADQAGDWGKRYYEAHTCEQLDALREELKGPFLKTDLSKSAMVRVLQCAKPPLKLPKELAKPKRA